MKVYESRMIYLVKNLCSSISVGSNRCLSDAQDRRSLQHARNSIFLLRIASTQPMLDEFLEELKLGIEEALEDLLFFLILFCSFHMLICALSLTLPIILTCVFEFYTFEIGF